MHYATQRQDVSRYVKIDGFSFPLSFTDRQFWKNPPNLHLKQHDSWIISNLKNFLFNFCAYLGPKMEHLIDFEGGCSIYKSLK